MDGVDKRVIAFRTLPRWLLSISLTRIASPCWWWWSDCDVCFLEYGLPVTRSIMRRVLYSLSESLYFLTAPVSVLMLGLGWMDGLTMKEKRSSRGNQLTHHHRPSSSSSSLPSPSIIRHPSPIHWTVQMEIYLKLRISTQKPQGRRTIWDRERNILQIIPGLTLLDTDDDARRHGMNKPRGKSFLRRNGLALSLRPFVVQFQVVVFVSDPMTGEGIKLGNYTGM